MAVGCFAKGCSIVDVGLLVKRYCHALLRTRLAALRQRSEQYLTLSQFFAHAFRHAIGLWQYSQSFSGKFDF